MCGESRCMDMNSEQLTQKKRRIFVPSRRSVIEEYVEDFSDEAE